MFTIVERLTGNYFAFKIDSKTTEGVKYAMEQLHAEFGEHFSEVFKTITADNGVEFASFSDFAHPYSSWERPVNERTNGMLRKFIRKGKSIDCYTDEQVRQFFDMLNSTPRKRLDYKTPEELFDEQLDILYCANC